MLNGITIEFATPESHCYLGCTSKSKLFVFQIVTVATRNSCNNMEELHRLYKYSVCRDWGSCSKHNNRISAATRHSCANFYVQTPFGKCRCAVRLCLGKTGIWVFLFSDGIC